MHPSMAARGAPGGAPPQQQQQQEEAQKAGVTPDLLKALQQQREAMMQQAGGRNQALGMQIPQGSIVDQNKQKIYTAAQNAGGAGKQQAMQQQQRLQQLANPRAGIGGATPPRATGSPPRGIADPSARRPAVGFSTGGGINMAAPGAMMPQPSGGPVLSPDAMAFLDAYKKYQQALQQPGLNSADKAEIERNFQMDTNNISSDAKAEAFQYNDTSKGLGASPPGFARGGQIPPQAMARMPQQAMDGMARRPQMPSQAISGMARRPQMPPQASQQLPRAPIGMSGGGIVALQGGGDPALEAALEAEGITDPQTKELVRRIYHQETSSGRNVKPSSAGARGHMQMMPATFRGVADDGWDIENPSQNMRAAIRYIKEGLEASGGDPRAAAAYYHGGPNQAQHGEKTAAYADAVARGIAPPPRQAAAPARPSTGTPQVPAHIDEQIYNQNYPNPPSGPPMWVPEKSQLQKMKELPGRARTAVSDAATRFDENAKRGIEALAQGAENAGSIRRGEPTKSLGEAAGDVGDWWKGMGRGVADWYGNTALGQANQVSPEERNRRANAPGGASDDYAAGLNSQPLDARGHGVAARDLVTDISKGIGGALKETAGPIGEFIAGAATGTPTQMGPPAPTPEAQEAAGLAAADPVMMQNVPGGGAQTAPGGGGASSPAVAAPSTPPTPQVAQPEQSLARKFMDTRLKEQNDPKRKFYDQLAGFYTGSGPSGGNRADVFRGQVAGSRARGQAWDAARDANLNADLDRESEESIYAMRSAISNATNKGLIDPYRVAEYYQQWNDPVNAQAVKEQIRQDMANDPNWKEAGWFNSKGKTEAEINAEIERRFQAQGHQQVYSLVRNSEAVSYGGIGGSSPIGSIQTRADQIVGGI